MSDETVILGSSGAFGRIELSRPSRRNALDNASAQRITRALADYAADPGCRGILLLGSGGDLCSGADLRDPSGAAPGTMSPRMMMLRELSRCPLPVVSVVDGWAVGLGVAMAAVTYATVVTDLAKFRLPEASMGIFPAALVDYLAWRMSPATVADLVLTGRTVAADEALRNGLAGTRADVGRGEAAALDILAAATRPSREVVSESLAWLRRERGGKHAD